MKLENQVCSLELSKKLKELGIKQESLWWWEFSQMPKRWEIVKSVTCPNEGKDRFGSEFYSALTVAELMKIYYTLQGDYPNYTGLGVKPESIASHTAEIILYLKENNL